MSTPFSVYSGQIHDLRSFDGAIGKDEGPFHGAARHRLYLELMDRGLVEEYAQVIWCTQSNTDAKQDDENRLLHTLKITSDDIAVVLKRYVWWEWLTADLVPVWENLVRKNDVDRVSGGHILIPWPKAKQFITKVTPISLPPDHEVSNDYH